MSLTPDTRALHLGRGLLDRLPAPQTVQDADHVRRHLDTGTHEAQVTRRLIDVDILEPLLRQRQGASQATHA